jgi:hypothetical protein
MAGTISLLNKDGDRLHTIYVGSAPESGKKTFFWKMRKELSVVIKEFPKATVVGVTDGARDNWGFLNEFTDRHIIDFYHVAEYLNEVGDIISSNDAEKEAWLSSRWHDLKHKPKTADAIIIELKDYLGTEKASDNRQRGRSESPDLFRKQRPHDDLPVSFERQFTHRLRRDGGCLQNTGQTTSWRRGHALDTSRRSRRSSTRGCRPNQKPMERILAQNLFVRRKDRGRLCRLIILYIIWESHPSNMSLSDRANHHHESKFLVPHST